MQTAPAAHARPVQGYAVLERYIVSCYAAEDGRAHRDNTTKGTAHRWFAVSINLNSESEGGEVSFPEYGPRSFKPPPGGAVVFSCSILHGVSKVTSACRSSQRTVVVLFASRADVMRRLPRPAKAPVPIARGRGKASEDSRSGHREFHSRAAA